MTALVPGDTCWTVEEIDRAGVLVDAADYYRMLVATASAAEKFILLSGWQFDTKVALLRGEEAKEHPARQLLAFLNALCEAKPDLHVYLLAWDFSVIYALEREWLQSLAFEWKSHERVHFAFNECIPVGGAHHQKFVVVDGEVAFVGSADLCEHRWDERSHERTNPNRTLDDGTEYGPYHEVQAFVTGAAAGALTRFFERAWNCASKEPLVIAPRGTPLELPANVSIALPATRVALSRTEWRPESKSVHEIASLYARAIESAERLVYIETQYLSARHVADALLRRFEDGSKPSLDVVLILPREPEATKEAIAVGVAQAELVAMLRQSAAQAGHRFGVYASVQRSEDGDETKDVPTYIHSKLMIVDDVFLTIGSANLNNRSMHVDTELNFAFEAGKNTALGRAIRRVRVSLLAEHARVAGVPAARKFARGKDLVGFLDALVATGESALSACEVPDPRHSDVFVDFVHGSIGEYLDPIEATIPEELGDIERWKRAFSRGISRLRARLGEPPRTDAEA